MRALLLLIALLTLAPAAVAQAGRAWESTNWSIHCSRPTQVVVPEMCDDENPVAAASFIRGQLEDASVWLRGLGFRGPLVVEDGREGRNRGHLDHQYLANIEGDVVTLDGVEVCGYFDLIGQTHPMGWLVVNGGHMIQFDGESNASGTAAHELFHAIEASYPYFAQRTPDHNWITEGMAQAIEAAYLNRADGVPVFGPQGHAYVYGHRDYSSSLYRDDPADTNQRYAASHFWLALGEMLGSADRVQYLHDILLHVDEENGGVEGADRALRAFEPGGLAILYPRVIARYAPDVRSRGVEEPMTSAHYTRGTQSRPVSGRFDRTLSPSVDPYSAHFVRLILDPTEGQTLGVTVTLADDPSAHLVVGDQVYSELDPLDAGAERNVFRTQVTEADTLFVRVVHAAPGATAHAPRSFDLRIQVEPLEACEGPALMATLDPEFVRGQALRRSLSPTGFGDRGVILPAAEYQRGFEVAETAPAPGTLRFRGLVDDGGVGCGDPLGTSSFGSLVVGGNLGDLEDTFTDPDRQAEIVGRMVERISNMSEAEWAARADSSFSAMEQLGSAFGNDNARAMLNVGMEMMAEVSDGHGAHTALRLFSPNAFGWQLDWLPPVRGVLHHGGVGGWQANAGAVVAVILPDVEPQSLRPGQTVAARIAAPPRGEGDLGPLLYMKWTGDFAPKADAGPMDDRAFQGEGVSIRDVDLAGTFEVTAVTGAEVQGRLRLSGTARRFVVRYRYTRDRQGRIDGDEVVDERESFGPLVIEGEASLPAAAEVTRPGRFIERTARLGEVRR